MEICFPHLDKPINGVGQGQKTQNSTATASGWKVNALEDGGGDHPRELES
jgi:hypothetical protein